jgi:hypothetical protein
MSISSEIWRSRAMQETGSFILLAQRAVHTWQAHNDLDLKRQCRSFINMSQWITKIARNSLGRIHAKARLAPSGYKSQQSARMRDRRVGSAQPSAECTFSEQSKASCPNNKLSSGPGRCAHLWCGVHAGYIHCARSSTVLPQCRCQQSDWWRERERQMILNGIEAT